MALLDKYWNWLPVNDDSAMWCHDRMNVLSVDYSKVIPALLVSTGGMLCNNDVQVTALFSRAFQSVVTRQAGL